MRRLQLTWAAIFGVFLLGAIVSIAALNSTVFSAHGFVRSYVEALARHDAPAALAMSGVHRAAGSSAVEAGDDLLTSDSLGDITAIRVVSDEVGIEDVHRVTIAFAAGGREGTSEFVIERNGSLFGLFADWRFVDSPLASIDVTVLHDRQFTANGTIVTTETPNRPSAYLVFAPGLYTFASQTDFLAAEPQTALVTDAAADARVTLDVQASEPFTAAVQEQVVAYLDACATQQVLLPTGCPFGYPVSDRISAPPVWSIGAYPTVSIVPGGEVGTWIMPRSEGVAHVTVDVRSLFDGTVRTADEDVPFLLGYELTITPDGGLAATAVFE